VCTGGAWSLCLGEVLPSTEICDGLDNDGNGHVDVLSSGCQANTSPPLNQEPPAVDAASHSGAAAPGDVRIVGGCATVVSTTSSTWLLAVAIVALTLRRQRSWRS
jgi:hypothetical protein